MQLKLKRSQKTGGVMASTVIFCLDARVEFTAEEQHSVTRYKLQNQIIYTSEGARRAAEGRAESAAYAKASTISIGSVDAFLTSTTSKLGHGLKAAAFGAVSAMRLTITVASLQRGQHIECKSLDELMGAEEAIMEACQNLKGYLQAASAFDGSEVLIDFNGDTPMVVAHATTPTPQLMAPAPAASYAPSDADQIAESWPEQAQYAAKPETFGLPFDWNDPATRKKIMIGGGIVLGLLMLRACNIL
jgi:hypothetical protein